MKLTVGYKLDVRGDGIRQSRGCTHENPVRCVHPVLSISSLLFYCYDSLVLGHKYFHGQHNGACAQGYTATSRALSLLHAAHTAQTSRDVIGFYGGMTSVQPPHGAHDMKIKLGFLSYTRQRCLCTIASYSVSWLAQVNFPRTPRLGVIQRSGQHGVPYCANWALRYHRKCAW